MRLAMWRDSSLLLRLMESAWVCLICWCMGLCGSLNMPFKIDWTYVWYLGALHAEKWWKMHHSSMHGESVVYQSRCFFHHLCKCSLEKVPHSPAILLAWNSIESPIFVSLFCQVSMCLGKTSTSTIARYGIKMIALLYNHEIAGESIPSVPRMLLGEEIFVRGQRSSNRSRDMNAAGITGCSKISKKAEVNKRFHNHSCLDLGIQW